MSQQLQNKEKCPRCGKHNLVTDGVSGEVFCGKCGFVIDEKISDNGSERIFSDSAVSKSRTGDRTSLTRHDNGLSSIINPINKDASGKPLSSSMKSSLSQLRKLDNRSTTHNSIDKNLKQALSELLKMKEKLSLSDNVSEKAAYIYRKVLERKLVRGRSITAMIASSLYAACRQTETPRTLKEVSSTINVTKKELSGCYRLIVKELDLKMPIIDSVSCIGKIGSITKLSEKTKRYAMNILKQAEKERILSGKEPMGLAASALYLASLVTEEHITQKTMAEASGVTEVTIRNRCKNLKKFID